MDLEDKQDLGGNIQLSGFREISPGEMVVVKKIVGSYARKFSDAIDGYEGLNVHLKQVHKTESSEKYEIHAKLVYKGKTKTSESEERNLFMALDAVLKKLEAQM